jgi:hypothetical protein
VLPREGARGLGWERGWPGEAVTGGGNGGMGRAASRGEGERVGFYRRASTSDDGVTARDARRGTGPRPARVRREHRCQTCGPWRAPGQYGAVAAARLGGLPSASSHERAGKEHLGWRAAWGGVRRGR